MIHRRAQDGYVLLMTLLAFMGIGGVVLAGFTQQSKERLEAQRYEHNQRVLREAKQALLMYAYNYPEIALAASGNIRGPGRLPCPDTDDPTGGIPDGLPNSSFNCISGAAMVGRFPYEEPGLDFYEALDASGEHLWYAVSSSFANSISPVTADIVNSDSTGTITVSDQTGGILYDGAVDGIAAVIIAPGSITRRDEDNNGTYEYTQVRNSDAQRGDPRNYLDTFNGFDNSSFVNGSNNAADSFILGPIFDVNESDFVINDQVIIVTADEVVAMAEMAVLDAYRKALDGYMQNIWAVPGNYRYPWMNAYADIADLNVFDAAPGENVGRVPFLNYFTDHDSHVAITDLRIDFDFTLTSMADANEVDPTYIDAFTPVFNGAFFTGALTLDLSDSNLSFEKIKFDGSADISSDDVGTLVAVTTAAGSPTSASVAAAPSVTRKRYFWDGDGSPLPQDGWELCPVVLGDGRDCARDDDAPYNFEPFTNWPDHVSMRIRVVELQFTLDPDFVIELDYDYTAAPGLLAPAFTYFAPTPADNARFTAVLDPASITALSVGDTVETSARNFVDVNVVNCEQDDSVNNDLNLNELGNPDSSTVPCTLDLSTNFSIADFHLTADYYPEIPVWVRENNWGNSVLMAYADDYSPAGGQDCGTTPPCLTVDHTYDGLTTDKVAVLVGSRVVPANVADLGTMFEGENSTPLDDVFDSRPVPGNDIMVVFDEI